MVKFLGSASVDLDAANGDGDTAMHLAAANGLNRVIDFLVSQRRT